MQADLARELAIVAKSLLVEWRRDGRDLQLDVADFEAVFRPLIPKWPGSSFRSSENWNWDELEERGLELAAKRINQALSAIDVPAGQGGLRDPRLGRLPVPTELMLFAAMLRRLRAIDEKLAKT